MRIIEEHTFYWCRNLKIVYFPEGLEKIDSFTFYKSGLKQVEFPASLRTVASGAFAYCRNLNIVQFREGLEVLGMDERLENGDLLYGPF